MYRAGRKKESTGRVQQGLLIGLFIKYFILLDISLFHYYALYERVFLWMVPVGEQVH
jgi:hypothetical protein